MERHFDCTLCGKCCYGQIPLTINDALIHADRFPLAIIWTPVRPGTKYFDHVARLGSTVRLPNRKEIALRIAPSAYIPAALPCPALTGDNKCAIHTHKPTRCRTMPFSPYREESHQDELLIPREGWECDTSTDAPLVYRDNQIVERTDFDNERSDLLAQAGILRPYADWLLASVPSLMSELMGVAKKKSGGHVVVSFFSLLPRLPEVDVKEFAAKQFPIASDFAAETAGVSNLKKHHQHYKEYAAELGRVLEN
jgi:Fe-S-cluster containining protein